MSATIFVLERIKHAIQEVCVVVVQPDVALNGFRTHFTQNLSVSLILLVNVKLYLKRVRTFNLNTPSSTR